MRNDALDSSDFANLILLIGDSIRDFHNRIRDDAVDPEMVIDWLDRADEALDVLIIKAKEAISTETVEVGNG